jgi:hypothetical protein
MLPAGFDADFSRRAYPPGDADRHPHRPPVMALAPEEVDRLEELHRERIADANMEAALDDVWNGLIEPYVEADRFDSHTFDRFQRVDDEARARIRKPLMRDGASVRLWPTVRYLLQVAL